MAKKKRQKAKVAAPRPKITTSTLVICLIITILIIILSAFFGTVCDYASSSDGTIKTEYLSNAFELVAEHPSWIITSLKKDGSNASKLMFLAVVSWFIFLVYKFSQDAKRTHRKGVEHGSAKWGDKREIQSIADKDNDIESLILKAPDGIPMYDEDGEFLFVKIDNNVILSEQVKLSLNTHQHLLNLNILVIGGSGSGKTRFFAKPNILCLNTSFVITDPKGEILQSTGWVLEKAGYKVRVLNLIEMNHSNNYNPFHYVYDNNGDLSEDNVKKMVDVLFKNTKGDGEQQDFWAKKGQTMLEAIVYLLFEESEYNAEIDPETKKIKPETRDLSHLNFFSVTEKMRKLSYPPKGSKKPDGFFMVREDEETEEAFRERQKKGFLCELDKDFIELEKRKGETLAGRLYKEVRNAPEETGQSFLSSANVKTFFFNLTNLRNLTCCDNIHLETLGDEKTALFILIPATNTTYNFVAAMMYTQMFDILSNRANFKYGGTLPVPVRCIMDEFANIGEIPEFDKVISFVRSMGMSLNVIVQNIAQLKARYEKTWEVITGNCDSLIFLGGQEESTLKYISESLGKETIDVISFNKTLGSHPSTQESNSIMGRELMMPNEVATMPISDCIVKVRAHNPFYCNKYPIEDHPNYRFLGDSNKDYIYLINNLKSVTVEEYEKQFINNSIKIDEKKVEQEENKDEKENKIPEKVDIKENQTADENDSKRRNEKLVSIYNLPVLKSAEKVKVSVDSDEYDYDDDSIDEAIASETSDNVSEEYISDQRFGEVSELSSLDLGSTVRTKKEEEESNEKDGSVSVENETENSRFGDVNENLETISLNADTEVSSAARFRETYAEDQNFFESDMGLY